EFLEVSTALIAMEDPAAVAWAAHAVNIAEHGERPPRMNPRIIDVCVRQVGSMYMCSGNFAEALPWFERTIAAAQKRAADASAPVSSYGLGHSLHSVGECHAGLGRFADALPWFERAVAA